MTKSFDYYSKTDLSKYAGQWVAILDETIIAHGKDLQKVHTKAKKISGNREPLFAPIPEPGILLL